MAQDIFQKKLTDIVNPLTADNATINWDGLEVGAQNISIQYQRGVTRYRTIGGRTAALVAGQPMGSISIGRLMTVDAKALFAKAGWDGCTPTTLTLSLANCDGTSQVVTFIARGVLVTTYGVQTEAEGLAVIDSVSLEFLQLSRS